jgi:hypothetical protein
MGRAVDGRVAQAWEQRIARQERSRLSIAAFCREEGVSLASFYAWRRRLGSGASRTSFLVPVQLPAAETPTHGIRIELPGGIVVNLPADASLDLVTAAIRAVLGTAERLSC